MLDLYPLTFTEFLDGYVSDFVKRIPSRLFPRTMLVWESIPGHLSQENKKFIFGQVRKGARASDFEKALHGWSKRVSSARSGA